MRGVVSAGGQVDTILFARDPALRGQKIENASQTALVGSDGVDAHRPLLQLRQHTTASQGHHGRPNHHAVEMIANLVIHLRGERVFMSTQTPARSGTRDQFAQRRQHRLIGGAVEKVFEKNRFGSERDHLFVQRGCDSRGNASRVGQLIRPLTRVLLLEPTETGHEPKSNVQIAAVAVSVCHHLLERY